SWTGAKAAERSAKSHTQPRRGSSGPETWTATRKECPCRRAHLWPGGTLGRRCAASMRNSLKISARGNDSLPGVQRKITGYHRDDEQHWVAELDCGHNQHVRHNPPWVSRPWVT